jgi:hypothetical protein
MYVTQLESCCLPRDRGTVEYVGFTGKSGIKYLAARKTIPTHRRSTSIASSCSMDLALYVAADLPSCRRETIDTRDMG